MHIQIDGDDLLRAAGNPAATRIIRSAAYFLLAAIGDIPEETDAVVPTGTTANPSAPSIAPAAMAAAANGAGVSAAGNTSTSAPTAPMVPALASNVLPFPPPPPPPAPIIGKGDDPNPGDDSGEDEGTNTGNVPPPPPNVNAGTAAQPNGTLSSAGTSPAANTAAAVAGVVSVPILPGSVEVDAAGLPWDERIHQKGKSKKKDLTWKLKKGIDPTVVVAVTAELAARRATSPAPTAGSLPLTSTSTGSNTVPVPPVPNGAAAGGVPAPIGVGSSVPVPPAPAVGTVGSSDAHTPYRKLIDKITDLTKAGKLTPAKVSEICTSHGSPSLMALKQFEALIPVVDKDIDAAALGLL